MLPESDNGHIDNPRNRQFAIFAAQPHEVHDVMYFLTDNNIPFKVMLGSYKGQRETSFTIPHDRLNDVILSGLLDEQESILVLSAFNGRNERRAIIVMRDTQEEIDAGVLKHVSRSEAEASDGWTFDPLGENWFIITQPTEQKEVA
jgi:hypothetical protein